MVASDQSDDLGSIAQDIMYGDQYLDLISDTYSDKERIAEFEINPKYYLKHHGIRVPDAIDVAIPAPGSLGKPPRVEFRWASRQSARAEVLAARRAFRELARLARATLNTREMKGVLPPYNWSRFNLVV